jgi:K+-sensing histidine kinase KdpD
MFGHVAGQKRRSRWAILSFLLALALAWSLVAMREQTILWVGLAVGLGISLLITFVSSRRLRRARRNDEREMQTEAQASEEASTDKRLTYEEVFQVQMNVDDASLAGVHEDEEWPAEVDEAMEIEAEGQPAAEESIAEEAFAEEHSGTSEEDVQALEPDLDEAVDHDEAVEVEADVEPAKALEVDDESQDTLQKMREEFAARAKEAQLRVKQREAELDEAGSAPKSKS